MIEKSISTNICQNILVYKYILLSFLIVLSEFALPPPFMFYIFALGIRHFVVQKGEGVFSALLVVDTVWGQHCCYLPRMYVCFWSVFDCVSCILISEFLAAAGLHKNSLESRNVTTYFYQVLRCSQTDVSRNLAQRECTVIARFSCKTRNLLREHMAVV